MVDNLLNIHRLYESRQFIVNVHFVAQDETKHCPIMMNGFCRVLNS